MNRQYDKNVTSNMRLPLIDNETLSVHRLHHTFILYTNIPWDQTNKLYSGQEEQAVTC